MRQVGWGLPLVIWGWSHGAIAETVASIHPLLQQWTFNDTQQVLQLTTHSTALPKYFVLREPDRVVVDVLDTSWTAGTVIQRYNGDVSQIRIAQFTDGITRFVLDWQGTTPPQPAPFQSFPQPDGTTLWQLTLNAAMVNTVNNTSPAIALSSTPNTSPTAVRPNPLTIPQGFPPALLPPPVRTPVTVADPPR